MGVSAAVFESAGKRTEHYVPGVYSRSHNVTSASGVSSGNLVIMGKSTGGKPATLLEFGSVAEAKETLVSGDLLNAVAYAFNGSADYVPQKVYAMRVGGATRASLTLKSGEIDLVKLNAWNYGANTNQLKMSIVSGTKSGSIVCKLSYKTNTVTSDDIYRESLKITGTGTSPYVTVSKDYILLGTIITSGETSEEVTEQFNFEDFPTISELATRISETKYWTAEALDVQDTALSSDLDTCTHTTLSTDGTKFYSNFKAFLEWAADCAYIDGDSIEVLTENTRALPSTIAYTYFTGGEETSYTAADWATALEALETEDIQCITTPSSDPSVHALISNHCTSMSSTTNRKERMFIVGGALSETDDTAIENAKALNNFLGSYIVDNAVCKNPLTGTTETIPGALLACMIAGMESAMAVNIPLTNKTLKVLGFGKVRTVSNIEKLIKAGILVCNPNPDDSSSLVIIRALTTYQSADLISNERSMVREYLYMDRDLRKAYSLFVGDPNNISVNDIKQVLVNKGKEWAESGYIIPSDDNENVWDIIVKVNGDKIYVTYSRYLTAPTNFIFVTASNHVYTSTVSV